MTKSLRLIFLLVWLLVAALPGQAEKFRYTGLKVKTILNNGPSDKKWDIVFLSDGFLKSQRADYEKQCKACLTILWSVSPFKELQSHFNAHVVYVDAMPGQSFDSTGHRQAAYPFGSEFSQRGNGMVKLTRGHLVHTAAANAPEADVIIVITTLAGRSHAGGYIVMANDQASLPHELGHLIGRLGDEYSSRSKLVDRESRPLPKRGFRQANLQRSTTIDPTNQKTLKKTAKWRHFFDLPGAWPLVSAYQGGYYREVDVWRPSYSCIMRSSQGALFCPVCHEEMYKKILVKCGESFNHEEYHREFPLTLWKRKMY